MVLLPGSDVLGDDAPGQVVIAVIATGVVEEVRPGREPMARETWPALQPITHHRLS